ncbi:hypothetical protein HYW20_00125 [Candidatus Woesearchaeota archaeon]|nr:hypothetical protein [Candidatus Woesearchaeota archaeon]
MDKAPVSLTGISHEFFLDSEIAESHTLDNIDTGDYLNVSILDNQDAYSDYSVIPINEFRQICPSLDCNVVDYITSKKKIKDIQEGDYVQSLDEKTGKIVANRVNELVDMGNKTVYELRTESGRSIKVG